MTNQEINEAVARKLGWTRKENDVACERGHGAGGWHFCRDGKGSYFYDPPVYSTDIKAAFEIVEEIKNIYALDCAFRLIYDIADQEWNCLVGGVCGRSDNPSTAICLAYLKLKQEA